MFISILGLLSIQKNHKKKIAALGRCLLCLTLNSPMLVVINSNKKTLLNQYK